MPQSPFNSCRLEAACQRALQGAACNQTAPTHLPASPIALCTCTLWSRRCFPPEDMAEGPGCPSAKCQMVHSHRTRDVARSHVAALAWGCSALGTWLLAWIAQGRKERGQVVPSYKSLSHAHSPHKADWLSWLQLGQAKETDPHPLPTPDVVPAALHGL